MQTADCDSRRTLHPPACTWAPTLQLSKVTCTPPCGRLLVAATQATTEVPTRSPGWQAARSRGAGGSASARRLRRRLSCAATPNRSLGTATPPPLQGVGHAQEDMRRGLGIAGAATHLWLPRRPPLAARRPSTGASSHPPATKSAYSPFSTCVVSSRRAARPPTGCAPSRPRAGSQIACLYPSSSCSARDSCNRRGEGRESTRGQPSSAGMGCLQRCKQAAAAQPGCASHGQTAEQTNTGKLPAGPHRPWQAPAGRLPATPPTHLEWHPLAALLREPGAPQHAVAGGGPVAGAQLAAAQVHLEGSAAHRHARLVPCGGFGQQQQEARPGRQDPGGRLPRHRCKRAAMSSPQLSCKTSRPLVPSPAQPPMK